MWEPLFRGFLGRSRNACTGNHQAFVRRGEAVLVLLVAPAPSGRVFAFAAVFRAASVLRFAVLTAAAAFFFLMLVEPNPPLPADAMGHPPIELRISHHGKYETFIDHSSPEFQRFGASSSRMRMRASSLPLYSITAS